jgi:hypothetical protein
MALGGIDKVASDATTSFSQALGGGSEIAQTPQKPVGKRGKNSSQAGGKNFLASAVKFITNPLGAIGGLLGGLLGGMSG